MWVTIVGVAAGGLWAAAGILFVMALVFRWRRMSLQFVRRNMTRTSGVQRSSTCGLRVQ